MLEKIDVNGGNAHPIYKSLRKHAPELNGENVPHNFGKFVIYEDKGKQCVKFYKPSTQPQDVLNDIQHLLK